MPRTQQHLARPADLAKTTTLADLAFETLRNDILSGALPAGSALRLEALKERYDWSFSPLREALNRLQSEQLVVSLPQRGFTVPPLSVAELRDATMTRTLVETEALRRSCRIGTDEWEAAVVAAFHALSLSWSRLRGKRGGISAEDAAQLEGRHLDFHMALIGACGSPRLLKLARQLQLETQRYRQPMLIGAPIGAGKRDVAGEHQKIMDATLARNSKVATRLLAEHYERTLHFVEAQLGKNMP